MGWMTINHMPESVFRNVHGISTISICTVYIYTGQMVENDDETQNLIYIYIYRYDWGKQFG